MVSTYSGIESAKNNVPQNKFKTTFAKEKTDDTLVLYILINALALGFTSGLAPMFNNSEFSGSIFVFRAGGDALTNFEAFSDEVCAQLS